MLLCSEKITRTTPIILAAAKMTRGYFIRPFLIGPSFFDKAVYDLSIEHLVSGRENHLALIQYLYVYAIYMVTLLTKE